MVGAAGAVVGDDKSKGKGIGAAAGELDTRDAVAAMLTRGAVLTAAVADSTATYPAATVAVATAVPPVAGTHAGVVGDVSPAFSPVELMAPGDGGCNSVRRWWLWWQDDVWRLSALVLPRMTESHLRH